MKAKLFSKKDCDAATKYVLEKEKNGFLEYEKDHRFGPDNKNTFRIYGDEVFKTLALKAQPKLEKLYGIKLYPTYTYTRLYKPGFILLPHLDRPACEFSSTVTIGYGERNSPWEIYIENDKEDGVEYILNPGEGVLYEGRKYHHWRMPLDKGWQLQTFVHYIEIGGEVYNDVLNMQPDFDFTIPFRDFDYGSDGILVIK